MSDKIGKLTIDVDFDSPSPVSGKYMQVKNGCYLVPVAAPGATRLVVTWEFGSESNNTGISSGDYLTFYKDEHHTDYWGEERYTEGMHTQTDDGILPLVILSDRFVLACRRGSSEMSVPGGNKKAFKLVVSAAGTILDRLLEAYSKATTADVVVNGGEVSPACGDISLSLLIERMGPLVDVAFIRSLLDRYPHLARRNATSLPDYGDGDEDSDSASNMLPLHVACSQAIVSPELVEVLLTVYPTAAEIVDPENNLPLHLAVQHGACSRVVTSLLKHMPLSALVHKNDSGETPLHVAVKHDCLRLSELLLLIEADSTAASVVDSDGRLPLHSIFMRPCVVPIEMISCIIAAYPGGSMVRDQQGKLPLHSACSAPWSTGAMVEKLVELYPAAVRERDGEDHLTAHYAACRLLAERANFTTQSDTTEDACLDTIDHTAEMIKSDSSSSFRERSSSGSSSSIAYEVYSSVIDPALDLASLLPLLQAVDYDLSPYMLEFLSSCGALDTPCKQHHRLALHHALIAQCPSELVCHLIDLFPAAVTHADAYLQLPLHHAIESKAALTVIQKLLTAHPTGLLQCDKLGRLPYIRAIELGAEIEIIQAIFTTLSTSTFATTVLEIREGNENANPLLSAIDCRASTEVMSAILAAAPQLANLKDPITGRLPLHKGTAAANVVLMRTFPEGASVRDNEGNLPLHAMMSRLSRSSHLSPLEQDELGLMLSAYPEAPCVVNNSTTTPLMMAVKCGCPEEAVLAMLQACPTGARVKDDEGDLPLHAAISAGCSQAVVIAIMNCYMEAVTVRGRGGSLPVHLLAVNHRYYDTISLKQMLIYFGGANQANGSGEYALSIAIKYNAPEDFLLFLLSTCPRIARQPDTLGNVTLHHLCSEHRSFLKLVQAVILAFPEGVTMRNQSNQTPLELLLNHQEYTFNNNHKDNSNRNGECEDKENDIMQHPLSAATGSDDYLAGGAYLEAMVGMMLQAAPEAAAIPGSDGMLPVHRALSLWTVSQKLSLDLLRAYPEAASVLLNADNSVGASDFVKQQQPMASIEPANGVPAGDSIVAVAVRSGRLLLHYAIEINAPLPVLLAVLNAFPDAARYRDASSGALPIQLALDVKSPYEFLIPLAEAFPEGLSILRSRKNLIEDGDSRSSAVEVEVEVEDTALTRAIKQRVPVNIIAAMLAIYPASAAVADGDGNLPLHIIFIDSHMPLVGLVIPLISAYSAAAKVPDPKYRKLPLHLICACLSVVSEDAILAIMHAHPAAVRTQDSDRKEPLLYLLEHRPCETATTSAITEESGYIADDEFSRPSSPSGCVVSDELVQSMLDCIISPGAAVTGARPVEGILSDALFSAIILSSDIAVVDMLLKARPVIAYSRRISSGEYAGSTSLHVAIAVGASAAVIESLLSVGPEACGCFDTHGKTPLHAALESLSNGVKEDDGDVGGVVLSVLCAYPQCAALRDALGRLPVHHAAKRSNAAVLTAVITAHPAGVKEKGFGGKLPLHSVLADRLDVMSVRALVRAYPEAAQEFDKEGFLPLAYAMSHMPMTAEIGNLSDKEAKDISKGDSTGDSIDSPDRVGEGALKLEQSLYEVLSLLLAAYPEGASHPVKSGDMPFQYALKAQCTPRILQMLLTSYPEAAGELIDSSIHPLEYMLENKLPSSLVYQCLGYFMPVNNEGQANAHHGYWWTHILSKTRDAYVDVVEMTMRDYSDVAVALAECTDEVGRKAVDIATPLCKGVITVQLNMLTQREIDDLEAMQLEVARLKTVVTQRDNELQALHAILSRQRLAEEGLLLTDGRTGSIKRDDSSDGAAIRANKKPLRSLQLPSLSNGKDSLGSSSSPTGTGSKFHHHHTPKPSSPKSAVPPTTTSASTSMLKPSGGIRVITKESPQNNSANNKAGGPPPSFSGNISNSPSMPSSPSTTTASTTSEQKDLKKPSVVSVLSEKSKAVAVVTAVAIVGDSAKVSSSSSRPDGTQRTGTVRTISGRLGSEKSTNGASVSANGNESEKTGTAVGSNNDRSCRMQ
jgi:ankyrin repeat protein